MLARTLDNARHILDMRGFHLPVEHMQAALDADGMFAADQYAVTVTCPDIISALSTALNDAAQFAGRQAPKR